MSFLGFLAKKKFYIHLVLSVAITLLLLLIVLWLLKSYTRHGEVYLVPDFTGKTIAEIQRDEANRIFHLEITDSVYDNSLDPGSVIKQNPSPGSKAKEGRTIYITTVSFIPEMSVMPELKDLTIRQAVTTLRAGGIKIRKLHFIPHFAENSVLGQYFDGDTLYAGEEIREGSEIDLVVGLGENRETPVPYLIGLTRDQARDMLNMASFNAGREFYVDAPDPRHSRVYRQFPWFDGELSPGDSVTLYLRSDLYFNFDSLRASIRPDTAVVAEPDDASAGSEDFDFD